VNRDDICERCGERLPCDCVPVSERAVSSTLGRDELRQLGAHPIYVAGRPARIVRERDGFAVYVEGVAGSLTVAFRSRGLPSEVIAQADEYVRGMYSDARVEK
jgi:hypothetical protein